MVLSFLGWNQITILNAERNSDGPGGSEIFEVFVVSEHLYQDCGSLKVDQR